MTRSSLNAEKTIDPTSAPTRAEAPAATRAAVSATAWGSPSRGLSGVVTDGSSGDGTARAAESAELAVVERCGFVESRHIGSAVVLGPDGSPLIRLGAPDVPVFTRSSLKPLQAIAAMSLGADVSGPSAALATASHKSGSRHAEVVTAMLASAGLDASALKCPSTFPADGAFRTEIEDRARAAGAAAEKSAVYFNCSGKHAAFLMSAVAQGADTATYLDPAHPVQRRVAEVVEAFSDETPAAVGVDGCGAPVFALSLTGLARAIGRVVRLGRGDGFAGAGAAGDSPTTVAGTGTDRAGADSTAAVSFLDYASQARTLMDGVFANPWGIQGEGHANTTVIERLGVFSKGGAEGVIVMATPSGFSVALKCLDGASRATSFVALHLLDLAGAFDEERAAAAASADDADSAAASADTADHAATSARDGDSAATSAGPVVTPELLAEVIDLVTDPITGGTDSEGRTGVVGRTLLGEDVARIQADGGGPMAIRRRIDPHEGRSALELWAAQAGVDAAPADRSTTATAVRFTLEELAARAEGNSVEVRVPPFGVTQCIPGPRHTRGTPPNVIETSAEVWLRLVTGQTTFAEAHEAGLIDASGIRADLSDNLPLYSLTELIGER